MKFLSPLLVLLGPLLAAISSAAALDPAVVPLLKRSFFEGREYFVLRSGRARLIAQADRADIAPAFLYLLFDAQDNRQSARKERAFNFGDGQGFANSALEVVLGGFPFTALGHRTQTRWVLTDGIPAAEAVWWAGGLRVTERLLALGDGGLFLRRIELASVNLGGPESVSLRLSLSSGKGVVREGWLTEELDGCRLALGVAGDGPAVARPVRGMIEVGPLSLVPGQTATVNTLLLVQIPPGEADPSKQPLPLHAEAREVVVPTAPAVWFEPVNVPVALINWAAPAQPCNEVFRHTLVSYGGPLRYRLHVPGVESVTLVFGFCEGYYREPNQRVLDVQIEGRSRQTVDPVAGSGANVPMLWSVAARDENADGVIDIAVAAAERSRDTNPILNVLWVFTGAAPPAVQLLEPSGEANASSAACVHAFQAETAPPGVPLPMLLLGDVVAKTRTNWEVASSLVSDDATVRELFDKARFGLAAMVADNGVMDAGIFEYGAQWVRDTSNTLLGMVHAGQFERARQGFAYVLEHMVSSEGNAMIAGAFDDPDREQFDQMGELLHALKAYRDWTGDESLLREHRLKLLALIERPLRPEFRDETGMVHNRREFWERALGDGYELAYQTYVVLGLREAAALAGPLGAEERAPYWRAEAERTEQAMLAHPTRALVENGRFIKRRAVTGERVSAIRFPASAPDVPLRTERANLTEPDATMALPIAFRLVNPRSDTARNTLDELERLWNARWSGGGYERYHSSGQCDQPGPWAFASCFILRAQHEAGMFDRSRRTLEWLNTVQGGRTGAWFEEIPLVRSQAPTAGLLPWTSGEISLFCVRHWLGVDFEGDGLVIRPTLYPDSPPVSADLRFRQGRLRLEIDGSGPVREAYVNGAKLMPDATGALRLPADFQSGTVVIRTRRP